MSSDNNTMQPADDSFLAKLFHWSFFGEAQLDIATRESLSLSLSLSHAYVPPAARTCDACEQALGNGEHSASSNLDRSSHVPR